MRHVVRRASSNPTMTASTLYALYEAVTTCKHDRCKCQRAVPSNLSKQMSFCCHGGICPLLQQILRQQRTAKPTNSLKDMRTVDGEPLTKPRTLQDTIPPWFSYNIESSTTQSGIGQSSITHSDTRYQHTQRVVSNNSRKDAASHTLLFLECGERESTPNQ